MFVSFAVNFEAQILLTGGVDLCYSIMKRKLFSVFLYRKTYGKKCLYVSVLYFFGNAPNPDQSEFEFPLWGFFLNSRH